MAGKSMRRCNVCNRCHEVNGRSFLFLANKSFWNGRLNQRGGGGEGEGRGANNKAKKFTEKLETIRHVIENVNTDGPHRLNESAPPPLSPLPATHPTINSYFNPMPNQPNMQILLCSGRQSSWQRHRMLPPSFLPLINFSAANRIQSIRHWTASSVPTSATSPSTG